MGGQVIQSDDDVVIASNRDGDSRGGDIIFKTGTVERGRLKSDGTGTGVFGSSLPQVNRHLGSKQGATDLIEPPPMLTPPTLTYGGAAATVVGTTITGGSSYTSPRFYRWDNANIRWNGGVTTAYTNAGYGSTIGGVTVPNADATRSKFEVLGVMCFDLFWDSFEILMVGAAQEFRIFIDGQPHSATPYTVTKTDGLLWTLKVTNLPKGRDQYSVKIECSAAVLGGIVLPPMASIRPPAGSSSGGAMLIRADSYGGAHGLATWVAYPLRLARRLGFDRVYVSAYGGTGILANNVYNVGTLGGNYRSRTVADRASLPDDISLIFNQGSTNDGNFAISDGGTALNVEMDALIDYDLAQWPTAVQVYTSTLRCRNPTANDLTVSALYKAKCAARGVTYIDQITDAWYDGTGNSVVTTGDGKADYLIQSDDSHPTSAGQRDIADRCAAALATAFSLPTAERTTIPRIDDGQAGVLAPSPPPNSTVAPPAQRVYYARFVATRTLKVTKIAYAVTVAASVNDNVEVGIYDASGARVATSGAVAGKLNATGVQSVTVTATLERGVYYAAIVIPAIGGTGATLMGYSLGNVFGFELFGTGAPAAIGGQQAGQATLPATAVITGVSGVLASLAVRET